MKITYRPTMVDKRKFKTKARLRGASRAAANWQKEKIKINKNETFCESDKKFLNSVSNLQFVFY